MPGVRLRKALNILPWRATSRLANAFNCWATSIVLRRMAANMADPVVLWIYDPGSARMVGSCGEEFAVYDCVDDYAEQSSTERGRALAAAGDRTAVLRSRLVFVTSRTMYERQRQLNPETHLVPNVGDYHHFSRAADPAIAISAVAGLRRPILGFAGNFLAAKVDFDLLEEVARARPHWSLLLIGPESADTASTLERLRAAAERRVDRPEAVRRPAQLRRRLRRRPDSVPVERLHAKLLPAQALRVPRGGEAGRGDRRPGAGRDGAGRRARRRGGAIRRCRRGSARPPRRRRAEAADARSHRRTTGKRGPTGSWSSWSAHSKPASERSERAARLISTPSPLRPRPPSAACATARYFLFDVEKNQPIVTAEARSDRRACRCSGVGFWVPRRRRNVLPSLTVAGFDDELLMRDPVLELTPPYVFAPSPTYGPKGWPR